MARLKKLQLCPKCSEPIVWSHNNTAPGSKSFARCSNHPETSTCNLKPGGTLKDFCDWEGITIRRPDGSVEIVKKRD